MKSIKRGIAVLLTAVLIMPNSFAATVQASEVEHVEEIQDTQAITEEAKEADTATETQKSGETVPAQTVEETSVKAETDSADASETTQTTEQETATQTEAADTTTAEATETQTAATETETSSETVTETETETEASQETVKMEAETVMTYNTGKSVCALSDTSFKEDGSYTIAIPEKNPFFPYEVQFTYDGKTKNEWFMTPDDKVTVGGHDIYVDADFDSTVVTQLSLNVAGQTVVVYPKKKTFEDNKIADAYSLLPLEEKELTVDLTGFTPVELTMVSLQTVFTGEDALKNTDAIVWTYRNDDNYAISQSGDVIDLSYNTYYNTQTRWEMIAGVADQLEGKNIRYQVTVKNTESRNWLSSTVYKQDAQGTRTNVNVTDDYYDDQWGDYSHEFVERRKYVYASSSDMGNESKAYLSMKVNDQVFGSVKYGSMKAFEGKYTKASELTAEKDITDKLFCKDMTAKDAGYLVDAGSRTWITFVTYDASGKATGCMSFELDFYKQGNYISYHSLSYKTENGTEYVSDTSTSSTIDGYQTRTYTLYKEYPVDGKYTQEISYYKDGTESNNLVTAAYAGKYQSISEAAAANAKDIKADLFGNGYTADYSKTVYFSIFVGADTDEKQEVYHQAVKTVAGEQFKYEESLSSATLVTFTGLKDDKGNEITSYVVGHDLDSYGEYSYLTIFVDKDTDLTKLAPMFRMSDSKINLYADDGAKQESGKNIHDFSKGPVQYSASAEDKKNSRNYWLQVVKAQESAGQIYVNSFKDASAGTKTENGVIHSKRELVIDGYHDNRHDILVANIGLGEIKELSAELKSDTLDMDTYWTFKGKYSLAGLNTIEKKTTYGELPNLAKIRLTAKDTVSAGDTLSGTLTIRSGSTTLAVLELTGTYGNPQITTKEIPQAVKYVPYGTMIQNNNKYSWNTVTYDLYSGKLPDGMTLKPNGELYGVPREVGEFQFTARMRNSASQFGSSSRQFTLTVIENSDKNVDNATDDGYDVLDRIGNVSLKDTKDQVFRSKGEFAEFTKVFLDGEELEPEKDYTAESGSTRITIKSETLGKQEKGKHTLGVEFRTKEDDSLKRAAQNFNVGGSGSSGGSSSSGGGSSSGSGSSSAGGQTAHNKANVTVTSDSVMETVTDDVVYHSIMLPSDDAMLRLSFFNKVYGDNAVVLAFLDNGIGYSLSLNAFLAAGTDLNLSTRETELEGFAQGFKTIWLSTAQKTQLNYDLGIHLTAGAEYANHPAYVFIFDEAEGTFVPYTETMAVENGNIGFYTRYLTDFIVMIAR